MKDLIFDFYGTLVGFSPNSVRPGEFKAYEFLRSGGFEIDYETFMQGLNRAYVELLVDAKKHHVEFTIEDIGQRFFKNHFDREADREFVQRFSRIHVDEWNGGTVFFPKMKEFIEELSRKYRLSVISNTHCPEIVQSNIKKMGVENHFAQVITSIEVGWRKPNPKISEHAFKEIGTQPDVSVFVGDTHDEDYLGATGVGMKAYLIDREKKWAHLGDETIETIFDLRQRV